MRYRFEWDPRKAQGNLRKHGIGFESAAELFRDPFALSLYDESYSESEERWITLGKDSRETLLVVVHTFSMTGENVDDAVIRIISARKATSVEMVQYERQEQE